MNRHIAQGTRIPSPASIIHIKWPEDKLDLMWALPWYFLQFFKNVFIQTSVSPAFQIMQLQKKLLRSCVTEQKRNQRTHSGRITSHGIGQKGYTIGKATA